MSERKLNAMRDGQDGLDQQDGLDGRKEKFTPGPWNVVDQREMPDVENDYWIQGGNTIPAVVCRIENCHLEEEANAYLIAAAPEMLEHGDEVTAFLAYLLSRDMLPYPYNKAAHSKIEKWKELSKKARGEE